MLKWQQDRGPAAEGRGKPRGSRLLRRTITTNHSAIQRTTFELLAGRGTGRSTGHERVGLGTRQLDRAVTVPSLDQPPRSSPGLSERRLQCVLDHPDYYSGANQRNPDDRSHATDAQYVQSNSRSSTTLRMAYQCKESSISPHRFRRSGLATPAGSKRNRFRRRQPGGGTYYIP